MTLTDYIIIILFSLLVLAAGLSFGRKKVDMKSFFSAGGTLPWWMSGLSLFMSFFSSGTFVVWGAIAYEWGWVAVTIQWTMALGGFIIGFFIAPRWKKTGVLTAAEFIRHRLGENTQKFYTYIFLFLSIFYTGAFLYPVAKLVNVSTGFSIEWAVILLGLIVMIYTAVGGLWAVVITDVLQFIILFAAVIVVVPLAFDQIGGVEGFIAAAPAQFFAFTNGEYTIGFLMAFCLYNTCFIGGNWAYVQRYTSVRSPKSAKKVGFLFGVLYLVSPVLWMIPPMIYRVLNGELSGLENEGAYLLICKQVLPFGMLGLMLGGMIFATASSVNTTLNISAAVFTNDIFKRLFPSTSESKTMKVARISTLVFGLLTIIVAMLIPAAGGIVEVVLTLAALTGVPLYGPPIWALFSKRQTGGSILAITITSLLVNAFFKFISPTWLAFALNRTQEMAIGVGIPLVLLGLSELLLKSNVQVTSKPSENLAPGEGTAENRYAIKVMSIVIGIVGLVILGLGVFANNGQAIVITVAIVVLLLAGLLILKSKKTTPYANH